MVQLVCLRGQFRAQIVGLNCNQCQPIGNVGFVEGLTPLFNGTVNICSQKSFQQEMLTPILGKVLLSF